MKPTYEELEAKVAEFERLEKSLKQNEENLKAILETIPYPLFAKNAELKYIECNQAFEFYLGKSRDQIIGHDMYDVSDKASADVYKQADLDLLSKKEIQSYETVVKYNDGKYREVNFHKNVIKNSEGECIGIVGLLEDISIRKKTENALIESEKKFRALIENSHDAIILLDKDGTILYRTPSTTRITGVMDDETIGKNYSEYLHPDDVENTNRIISYVMENPEEAQRILIRRLGENNLYIYLDCVVTNMLDEPGVNALVVNLQNVTENIEKENEIKNQLAFQQALINSIPYPVFVKNSNAEFIGCNSAFEREFGISREYFSGKTALDLEFLTKEERERFQNEDVDVIANAKKINYELPLHFSDENIHSTLYSVNGFTLIDGSPGGLIGIIVDISKLKAAQKEIERINKIQSIILENSSVGIAYISDRKFKWCNLKIAEQFIMPIEDMQDKSTRCIFPSVESYNVFANEYEKLARGEHSDITLQLKRSNGEKFWCRFVGSAVDINNPTTGSIWIIEDISERIASEEKIKHYINELNEVNKKLTESELKFRLISDYCSDWEMFRDRDNKVLYCSPSIESIMGYTAEEYLKLSFADVVYPEDYEYAVSAHKRLFQNAENVEPVTFRLIKKSGEIVWVEVNGLPVFTPDGKHIGSRTSTHDISKLKTVEMALRTSEAELKESNSTKDKFFSIIAHDLKNPLGNFKEISRLLADDYDDLQEIERREFLDLMKHSASNVYSLLENLLEWSRSQRGQIQFNPCEFNFKFLSVEIVKLLKPSAENKNITLINNIPVSFPIFADENMINTVVRNLISNAIKFTHPDGTITLDGNDDSDNTIISISDTGVGMSTETIDMLFRIDSKVSTMGTSNETGTGLGLILCKEFIEKHNGTIRVESELGKGSNFIIALPRMKNGFGG